VLSVCGSSVCGVGACVSVDVDDVRVVDVDGVVVDAADRVVVDAVRAAAPRLAAADLAWPRGARVHLHHDVHAFVQATGQTTPTLRAWTAGDAVHLLPRDTWRAPDDATARLAHELCHVALTRRAGGRPLPRFGSEGVCSVVAGQESARMPLDAVRAAVADRAALDFDGDSAFAYGFAHHAVARAVACGRALGVVVDVFAARADVVAALGAAPEALLGQECPEIGDTAQPLATVPASPRGAP
jgi:hypothetical protein